ncbi:MAG: hypothetical protein QNK05_19545 [Myxococcota bacterium]|nr:hypothetical protein [Myxococcota bacterium]
MSKSVPLSVRVPAEDAEFLARLRLDGASTPSDKVRSLLADARRRHDGFRDYASCLAMSHEMLAPTLQLVQELENRTGVHSEPVSKLAEWLPEALAFFLTTFPEDGEENDLEQIHALERGSVDRIFRLISATLRLGVTQECQAYDRSVIRQRIPPVLELADIVRAGMDMPASKQPEEDR